MGRNFSESWRVLHCRQLNRPVMTDRYSESLPKHGGDAFNHSAWGDFNVVHLLSMSNHTIATKLKWGRVTYIFAAQECRANRQILLLPEQL